MEFALNNFAEQDGKHYYFTTKEKFQAGIEKGAFLEHAQVHSHFYGTSAAAVRKVSNVGKCCILDIDVQGARQVCGWPKSSTVDWPQLSNLITGRF